MQDLKVTLLDWDIPRNPELRLYVRNPLYYGSHHPFLNDGRIKALRDRMPGTTADFVASVLNKGIVRQITTKPSQLEGFASIVCLEPELELDLPSPYTKYLARIVAHAELPEWAGPVCRTRLRAYNAAVADPAHSNHPFTRQEIRLCRRFGVAMQKLATL